MPALSSGTTLPDTPDRILDAAERLFMAHGFDGTSMRMVTAEAAVNLAAVNYHFGSKEGLMQAVFRRRLAWLNSERLRLLDEMEVEARGKPLRPSRILEAFFGTLLAIGEDDARGGIVFLKLLGRTLTEPAEFIRAYFADEYAEVVERYKAALYRAIPDTPKEEIAWRFHFMLGATSYAIAGTDTLSVVGGMDIGPDNGPDLLCRRLMPFLLGGLRAPLPQFDNTPPDLPATPRRKTRKTAGRAT